MNDKPVIYFDDRDGEWTVHYKGQSYSDLCAGLAPDVAPMMESEFRSACRAAYLLNTAAHIRD